jgi:hypothetical protein
MSRMMRDEVEMFMFENVNYYIEDISLIRKRVITQHSLIAGE